MEYENGSDYELEKIMAQSPVLAKLLDPLIEVDTETWFDNLMDEKEKWHDELSEKIANLDFLLVLPQAQLAVFQEVFTTEEPEECIDWIETAIAIGYQLKNEKSARQAYDHVFTRFFEVSILKDPAESVEEAKKISLFVWFWIVAGGFIKNNEGGNWFEKDEDELPGPFADFFNKNPKFKDFK